MINSRSERMNGHIGIETRSILLWEEVFDNIFTIGEAYIMMPVEGNQTIEVGFPSTNEETFRLS